MAYRASDGEALWEAPAGTGIVAAPISYAIDGRQYVAVMAGWGGAFALVGGDAARAAGVRDNAGRLLVFERGGAARLPGVLPVEEEVTALAETPDAELVKRGNVTYQRWCAVCHGVGAIGGGVLPDLRASQPEVYEKLPDFVLGGVRQQQGMPSFARWLDEDDVASIRAYLVSRRNELVSEGG